LKSKYSELTPTNFITQIVQIIRKIRVNRFVEFNTILFMNDKNIKFIFFIIAILIIGFFFSSDLVPIKNFFISITEPVSIATTNSSNSFIGFFSNIRRVNKLLKENDSLVQENNQLKAQMALLSEVNHENEILKNQLGFIGSNNQLQLIPSKVILHSPSSYLQTLRIDKGSNDGIKEKQAVLSDGFLVGVISEVGANYSEVSLITNARTLLPIVLQNSRGSGLLQGGLKGLMGDYIALDIKVEKDESVVTSGLGGDLPSGIVVGNVAAIISSQSEIFQKVSIKSPIEFSKLEYVFVLK